MPRKRRRRPWSLIIIVAVAVLCLAYTVLTSNRPFLGLDLQGGVSVVLAPPKGVHPSSDSLDEAINIINNRINSFGVSEAQVSRQGDNILVEIPGVKDKDRALKLVGETAELQFRPVLAVAEVDANGYIQTSSSSPSTTAAGATTTTVAGATTTTAAGATTTTAASTATTGAATSTTKGALGVRGTGEQAGGALAATSDTVSDLAAATTTTAASTTTTAAQATTTTAKGATTTTAKPSSVKATTLLTSEADLAKPNSRSQEVVLPYYDSKTGKLTEIYQLGPTYLTGSGLSTASSDLNQQGQWEVRPVFRSGAKGIDLFNKGAGECNSKAETCPTGQMAIVLDNRVLTAPNINDPSYQADQITISGNFTQSEVKDIATALKYGALPVPLKPQTSEIVSATLGRDALKAGLIAGLVGFILVAIYMVLFYRILGLLATFKLVIEGCILWAFLCWAGSGLGLAITLAGLTGIVVSIGVSLDSNVVYYEHLKEDVRAGRTIRTAVDKSFHSAWRTIVAADMASVIGAAVLYWFTVGAVRGFAFYLGLATALDLVTSYCYMRPAVALATRSTMCVEHPHRFGLPDEEDVEEASRVVRELVTEGTR